MKNDFDIHEWQAKFLKESQRRLLKEDSTLRSYQIARDLIKNTEFPEDAIEDKELFLATIKALNDLLYQKAADLFSNAGSSPDEFR